MVRGILYFIKRKLFVEDFSLRTQLIFVSILMIDKSYLLKVPYIVTLNLMFIYTFLYIFLWLILCSPHSYKARLVRGISLITLLCLSIFNTITGYVIYGSALHLVTQVLSYINYSLIILFLIFERKYIEYKKFDKKLIFAGIIILFISFLPSVLQPILKTVFGLGLEVGLISGMIFMGLLTIVVFLIFLISIQHIFNNFKVTATILLVPIIIQLIKYVIVNSELYELMQYM